MKLLCHVSLELIDVNNERWSSIFQLAKCTYNIHGDDDFILFATKIVEI